ncbi:MAG: ABC transporter permease subunit [Actinobacteria bacterium]|nr:ABC transporter permease subunit [Actinomycetota bacterium]
MSERGLGAREDVDLLLATQEGVVVESAPKAEPQTPMEWMRQNLFSGWVNALITLASAAFVVFVFYQAARFLLVSAEWEIVRRFLRGYMVGSFPVEELWRVWTCVFLVGALAGLSAGSSRNRLPWPARRIVFGLVVLALAVAFLIFAVKTPLVWGLITAVAVEIIVFRQIGLTLGYQRLRRPLLWGWALSFPVVIIIVRFIGDGVAPRFWEGFFFNIIAATVGIFASFPIGILLALGRRSSLPAVRFFCVGFIEIFRGVPLVAWLVFSKYVVDLLLPPQVDLPDIIKALVAMTLFSSAYIAEIVRGGLQGIDRGQYEAGRALGLSTPRLLGLVILPQALRSTIPAMISHFISLFKDTSLFTAIDVTELLSAARRSSNALEFQGHSMETLLFASLIFWIVAFSMARWSQRLELRLGIGER